MAQLHGWLLLVMWIYVKTKLSIAGCLTASELHCDCCTERYNSCSLLAEQLDINPVTAVIDQYLRDSGSSAQLNRVLSNNFL